MPVDGKSFFKRVSRLIERTLKNLVLLLINFFCSGSNQIEGEIYLLFHCPKYSIFRDRFYRKIEYHLPNIRRLSTLEATKELMNSDNYFD